MRIANNNFATQLHKHITIFVVNYYTMKIIAIILSLYILVLTAIPCIDVPQDNTLHKTELSTKTSDNQQNRTDNCSPFWPCNCCVIPIVSKGCTLSFNCFSYSQTHFAPYQSGHFSNLSLAIWQPPKIA